MNRGGYNNNNNNINENEEVKHKTEKGGMLPCTAKIIKGASIHYDNIEYLGITVNDITLVGYLIEYEDLDTRIRTKIWDQTGTIDVVFFNKNESEPNIGLKDFRQDQLPTMVRMFGTAKVFKNAVNIQGAKLMNVNMNELVYHKLDTINDWSYLTKESNNNNKVERGSYVNNNNSNNFNNSNNNNNENNKKRQLENAIIKLGGNATKDTIARQCTFVSPNELHTLLNELANDGSIIYEDGSISKL